MDFYEIWPSRGMNELEDDLGTASSVCISMSIAAEISGGLRHL